MAKQAAERLLKFAPLGVLLVVVAGCPPPSGPCGVLAEDAESRDRQLAICLATDPALTGWAPAQAAPPVVLYVDRSGSMRGYLAPEYPAQQDYRAVIDRLIVALQPREAFGYGSALEQISTSIGTLGDRNFYSDNNTEMEDALDRIAADSVGGVTHLIIGDGRRSDPNAANGQYSRMRDIARQWIERGGTFLLAASRAPFQPIPGDPAGCKTTAGAESRCPLYAFAFIAKGSESQVVGTFAEADAFEHIFVWPLPPSAARISAEQQTASIAVESGWETAGDGVPIARVRGQEFTNVPVRGKLDSVSGADIASRSAQAALGGHTLRSTAHVRPLAEEGLDAAWLPTGEPGSLVRVVPEEPTTLEFLSHGATADRFLYKVEWYPTGDAAWIRDFDAENAGDAVRTYGLGRLFELFRVLGQAEALQPVHRAYVVAN